MPEPLVVCDGVTVRFGATTALAGLELTVSPGEFLCVVGHSGAGKTTLLSVLAGLVVPDEGLVTIDETPIRSLSDAASAGVLIVPQGNGLAAFLTARENVLVPLLAPSHELGDAAALADRALGSVGLTDHADHLLEELSGGQQQRVAVARGLARRSRVLLADEPTSELDHASREVVLGLLRARADAGGSVVMTTHDPEVARTADRTLHLDDGRLVLG